MNFTINFKLLESLWRLHEKSLVSIPEVGIEERLQKLCLCKNSHFLWLCNRTPSSPIARESLKRAKSSDWLQAVLLLHFLLYLCTLAELLLRSAYKYGIGTQHPLERSRFANQSEKIPMYFRRNYRLLIPSRAKNKIIWTNSNQCSHKHWYSNITRARWT